MKFPNGEVITITGNNSTAEFEHEYEEVTLQLRSCHQTLFQASCMRKRVLFEFTSAEMQELQRRQELIVCHKQHAETFLNKELKRSNMPFRLDLVEQEGRSFKFSFMVKEVN